MATPLEVLNHRLTASLAILALVGAGLAFMDSRHASAMDVQQLTEMIWEDRVDELEFKIEDVENAISRILSMDPPPEWADLELQDLENRKERYIRKLDRLLGEE